MSVIIAVASGKGGVGKTLITASLATALHRLGHTVLAADADMGLRNLDLMFGLENDVLYDAGDILKGRCRSSEALLTIAPGFDFLAASQKHTWEKVDTPTYHYVIERLAKDYDYVILDCPPGRGQAFKDAIALADRIFFVIEPSWASMRDAARVMQFCHKRRRFNYDVLFNNFYRSASACVSLDEMLSILNPEGIAGVLPHDERANRAAQTGQIAHMPDGPFTKALAQTAAYIETGNLPDMEYLQTLLPDAEGIPDEEDGDSKDQTAAQQVMKEQAAAELQRAAAALQRMTGAEKTPDAAVPAVLSLRSRREQSASWRRR